MSYDKKCHKVHVLWTFCVNGLNNIHGQILDFEIGGRKQIMRAAHITLLRVLEALGFRCSLMLYEP